MSTPRGRQGSIVIVVVLAFLALAGFAALVVDVGYLATVTAQLQVATDAASIAGAQRLDGTRDGMTMAESTALELGGANDAAGGPVSLTAADIELGIFDRDARVFTSSTDPEEVNAVQVSKELDGLTPFFSAVAWGQQVLQARATSVTARSEPVSAGGVECFMPLAIPSCIFDTYDADQLNDVAFVFGNNTQDNLGWAMKGAQPNANNVRAQLDDCESAGELTIEDEVQLSNGELASALEALAAGVNASDTAWDSGAWGNLPPRNGRSGVKPARYGNTFEGPVVVYQSGSCANPGFTGSAEVVGFAWAAVYDVLVNGAKKGIRMRLEVLEDYEYGTRGGSDVDGGIVYIPPPRLVY